MTYDQWKTDSGYAEKTPEQENEGRFSEEMQEALRQDAEKLSAMTGEEHTVEFFSAPWDGEPVAWVVMADPDFKWHFVRTRQDAEHTAHNFLTYAKGCTGAQIAPLFAGEPIPIAKRTYGFTKENIRRQP